MSQEMPTAVVPNNATRVANPSDNDRITATSCIPAPGFSDYFELPALPVEDRDTSDFSKEDLTGSINSYDSLLDRIRAAREPLEGACSSLRNIMSLLLSTTYLTIIIGMMLAVPISMIAMGSIYLYDCPQLEFIPVYLIVGGIFYGINQLLCLYLRIINCEEGSENERESRIKLCTNGFTAFWFVVGTILVYMSYKPNYDPLQGNYCNKTLYLFAFWLTTCMWIALGLIIICFVLSIVFHEKKKKRSVK